jgi:hypothetical protein
MVGVEVRGMLLRHPTTSATPWSRSSRRLVRARRGIHLPVEPPDGDLPPLYAPIWTRHAYAAVEPTRWRP